MNYDRYVILSSPYGDIFIKDDNAYVLPQATVSTLGGVKLSDGGGVGMDEHGNMVISTVENSDIENLFT